MKPYLRFGLSVVIVLSTLILSSSFVIAEENNYGNIPFEEQVMNMASMESVVLPFDPNDYNFLIYVPNGEQDSIEHAMSYLGITLDPNKDIRGPYNEVTANDLATHDILIVGWNYEGDTRGLIASTLAAGITGRIVLSGHDLDYHTSSDPTPEPAAPIVLAQAIDFVLQGEGTGMITLGCTSSFPYVPGDWGVSASGNVGEIVTEFTPESMISGIFDGVDLKDMCNWGTSYHNIFTINTNSSFMPFELGEGNDDIITVARMIPGLNLMKTDSLDPIES